MSQHDGAACQQELAPDIFGHSHGNDVLKAAELTGRRGTIPKGSNEP